VCTGKYSVVMDSDAWHFGGKGRVAWDGEHFTAPATEEEGGKFHDRDQYFQVSVCTLWGLRGWGLSVPQ
jgi:1,4-alpha-glucan branching enzyme